MEYYFLLVKRVWLITLPFIGRFLPNLVTITTATDPIRHQDHSWSGATQGSQWSKVHFYKKSFNLNWLGSRITRFVHMMQHETLHKSYRIKTWSKVIWGHWGQKGNLHKNCNFSYSVYAMVLWPIHTHLLKTAHKYEGSKGQLKVIWGQILPN